MARLCLGRAVGICFYIALFVKLAHFVGVSVIGGYKSNAFRFIDSRDYTGELYIERFERNYGRLIVARVSDHVSVQIGRAHV